MKAIKCSCCSYTISLDKVKGDKEKAWRKMWSHWAFEHKGSLINLEKKSKRHANNKLPNEAR